MRIKIRPRKKVEKPEIGDKRTVTRFAWLPVVVKHSGLTEVRWLETVEVVQRWSVLLQVVHRPGSPFLRVVGWRAVWFVGTPHTSRNEANMTRCELSKLQHKI